jgi:hypothetical protein
MDKRIGQHESANGISIASTGKPRQADDLSRSKLITNIFENLNIVIILLPVLNR